MKTAAEFWGCVDKSGSCWLWIAGRFAAGYGSLSWRGKSGSYAHRVAWELTNGPIPDGLCVCHHCDVPACVNPAHLFLGTHKENMQDMARKGRNRAPRPGNHRRGETHPRAALTDAIVRILRAAPRGQVAATARALGINKWTAHDAVSRKWRHVQ